MKYHDITTKRTYEVDGETKTKWLNVGTLRETDDGKMFIELNIFPNTSFYVFEQKERGQPKSTLTSVAPNGEQIDLNDVPF